MSKFVVGMGLFFFGFVLSIPVLLLGGYASIDWISALTAEARATSVASTSDTRGLSADLISRDNRIEVLESAINEGTIDSFQMIRKEHLVQDPSYSVVILPKLKKYTLVKMLALFQAQDWERWSQSRFAPRENASSARRFVDDLLATNSDLGLYADNAATLFQGLKQSLSAGHHYDINQDVKRLEEESGRLKAQGVLADGGLTPQISSEYFDSKIASDPAFRAELERQRCWHTEMFMTAHVDDLQGQLVLLRGLTPKFCDAGISQSVSSLLGHLVMRATPLYRKKVLYDPQVTNVINAFADRNVPLSKAFARFYVVGALDSLNVGDVEQANKFLLASKQVFPGLSVQLQLMVAIREAALQKGLTHLLADETLPAEEKAVGGPSGAIVSAMLVCLAVFMLLYRQHKNRAHQESLAAFESDLVHDELGDVFDAPANMVSLADQRKAKVANL